MNNKSSLKLDNGKYEIILKNDPKDFQFSCLRYDEEWRDLAGDKMVMSLFEYALNLENKISKLMTKGEIL